MASKNKSVSVIMPCYNDGAYIEESVSSVRNQTYSDIELIIINDGSDDKKTVDILEGLSKDGITVLETEKLGPARARNVGIKHANGKYILPLDSDDIIDATYIEKAVKIIESDDNIGGVYCLAEFFDKRQGRWVLPAYSLEQMLLDNVIFITTLFLKSDWETAGGFDESLIHGMEDYDFWLSIIEMGKTFYTIPEVLFFYRIKSLSRTSNFMSNSENVNSTYAKIFDNHKALYARHYDLTIGIMRRYLIDFSLKNYEYSKYIKYFNAFKKFRAFILKVRSALLLPFSFLKNFSKTACKTFKRKLASGFRKTKIFLYPVLGKPYRMIFKRKSGEK